MRKLTQPEIDAAPERATHYRIIKYTDTVILESVAEHHNLDGKEMTLDDVLYLPIPRKEFDISEYLESDPEHPSQQPHIFEEDSCLCIDGKVSEFHAIGIAKYFKLTAEDLK